MINNLAFWSTEDKLDFQSKSVAQPTSVVAFNLGLQLHKWLEKQGVGEEKQQAAQQGQELTKAIMRQFSGLEVTGSSSSQLEVKPVRVGLITSTL